TQGVTIGSEPVHQHHLRLATEGTVTDVQRNRLEEAGVVGEDLRATVLRRVEDEAHARGDLAREGQTDATVRARQGLVVVPDTRVDGEQVGSVPAVLDEGADVRGARGGVDVVQTVEDAEVVTRAREGGVVTRLERERVAAGLLEVRRTGVAL